MDRQGHLLKQLARLSLVLFTLRATFAADETVTYTEPFEADPLGHGWRAFGDTNLFLWKASAGSLEVTWDSSRPNSYLQLPLGTVLSKSDDFSFALDLLLTDAVSGPNPLKPSVFPLAFGFQNAGDAERPNFGR